MFIKRICYVMWSSSFWFVVRFWTPKSHDKSQMCVSLKLVYRVNVWILSCYDGVNSEFAEIWFWITSCSLMVIGDRIDITLILMERSTRLTVIDNSILSSVAYRKFTIIVIFLDSCVIYFALKSKLKLKWCQNQNDWIKTKIIMIFNTKISVVLMSLVNVDKLFLVNFRV